MNNALMNSLLQELCPDGIWQLSDLIKSILRRQISNLPMGNVLKDEIRYPKSPAAMRVYLIRFFSRHYFQTQNSLFKYITSQDFYNTIRLGRLRILEVGSGPAITSLAITDMLNRFIQCLEKTGQWPKGKSVKVDYILNDTCSLCLGTGKLILTKYFHNKKHRRITCGQIISMHKDFPDNLSQLQRIRFNIGKYDITTFSHAILPMIEGKGFKNIVLGLFNVEKLCNFNGRILILEDRFRAELVQQISRAIGISYNFEKIVQQIYPERNMSEIFTYSHYSSLYIPTQKMMMRQNYIA
ncbi:MAG: hypothetical protein ACYSR9_07740 [Planctomycetota bacterium]|jgi:hypothetical protein